MTPAMSAQIKECIHFYATGGTAKQAIAKGYAAAAAHAAWIAYTNKEESKGC